MNTGKWDTYFKKLAFAAAEQSSCLSRKVGAVIAIDKYPVSPGYNGVPEGFPHPGTKGYVKAVMPIVSFYGNSGICEDDIMGKCFRKVLGLRSGEGVSLCGCSHAERNAISIAARFGHSTEGSTMYIVNLEDDIVDVCSDCAGVIIAAGIKEIVCDADQQYGKGIPARAMFEAAGVKVRKYVSEAEGI